jgi:hypothetical protein
MTPPPRTGFRDGAIAAAPQLRHSPLARTRVEPFEDELPCCTDWTDEPEAPEQDQDPFEGFA